VPGADGKSLSTLLLTFTSYSDAPKAASVSLLTQTEPIFLKDSRTEVWHEGYETDPHESDVAGKKNLAANGR
jgi:hypothetical protein